VELIERLYHPSGGENNSPQAFEEDGDNDAKVDAREIVYLQEWSRHSHHTDGAGGSIASTIPLGRPAFALTALGAAIVIFGVAVIAFLSKRFVPFAVSTTSWSSASAENIRDTVMPVCKILGPQARNPISNSECLESFQASRWVGIEGFVNATPPA
jgi:hypothetical protein